MSHSQEPFELITALSYDPAAPPAKRFHLLPLHFARLREAHAALAAELSGSWCSSQPCPTEVEMRIALGEVVEGREGRLRVRLVVGSEGVRAEAFALSDMPDCEPSG